jgi:hypothetical protein
MSSMFEERTMDVVKSAQETLGNGDSDTPTVIMMLSAISSALSLKRSADEAVKQTRVLEELVTVLKNRPITLTDGPNPILPPWNVGA